MEARLRTHSPATVRRRHGLELTTDSLVAPSFAGAVLGWAEPRLRDLPWRRTRDPWAVLVSEVMLQQTQVPRVVPKYLAFLDAFPTAVACAAASLGDVLRLWQGLGYPRRARNLHAAASAIADADELPNTLEGLLRLPGVGPYTARAVLAFAFEADVAVVDTNIARVYARVLGRSLTARQVQSVADGTAPRGDAWAWNQSIMELGAMVCRPVSPACDECPAGPMCAWRGSGDDPAVGSAGVSTGQGRFDGSDRQARGRVLRAASEGPVPVDRLATITGRSPIDATRIASGLADDGLLVRDGPVFRLP